MLLSDILYNISLITVSGKTDIEIEQITFDSRQVNKGTLFVAVPGTQSDGHDYIETAINAGASAVLCEVLPKILKEEVTYIQVENSAKSMGIDIV